jgi:hypothetical protein
MTWRINKRIGLGLLVRYSDRQEGIHTNRRAAG